MDPAPSPLGPEVPRGPGQVVQAPVDSPAGVEPDGGPGEDDPAGDDHAPDEVAGQDQGLVGGAAWMIEGRSENAIVSSAYFFIETG